MNRNQINLFNEYSFSPVLTSSTFFNDYEKQQQNHTICNVTKVNSCTPTQEILPLQLLSSSTNTSTTTITATMSSLNNVNEYVDGITNEVEYEVSSPLVSLPKPTPLYPNDILNAALQMIFNVIENNEQTFTAENSEKIDVLTRNIRFNLFQSTLNEMMRISAQPPTTTITACQSILNKEFVQTTPTSSLTSHLPMCTEPQINKISSIYYHHHQEQQEQHQQEQQQNQYELLNLTSLKRNKSLLSSYPSASSSSETLSSTNIKKLTNRNCHRSKNTNVTTTSTVNRLSYPREFKLMVIERYAMNGKNKYKTCKEFQITKSMLNGWLQKADKIRSSRPGSLKSGRSGRKPLFPDVEKQLFKLYAERQRLLQADESNAKCKKISNQWIRETAKQLARQQCTDRELLSVCQFSERWLTNFKKRYLIYLQNKELNAEK